MNTNPAKPEEAGLGVWNIPCSREWYPGGPMKQELTVHATGKSPITIQMLQGEHFGTSSVTYQSGQKKLYGPFLIYMNSGTRQQMIADAKREAHEQEQQWPFEWFNHENYPHDRATVSGRIQVTTGQRQDSIQVVLCDPDTELYRQTEGYIFWALTDAEGRFCIKNVRKGNYALRAYATKGDITDELMVENIKVEDDEVNLNTFTWTPTSHEHQLFIIGENNLYNIITNTIFFNRHGSTICSISTYFGNLAIWRILESQRGCISPLFNPQRLFIVAKERNSAGQDIITLIGVWMSSKRMREDL